MNLGGPEIVVVFLVALLVLGPEQLPKAMRTIGNVMAEIRKVSGGFQSEMRKAMDAVDIRGDADDKPQSPRPPSGHPDETSVPADSAVTEVVARNEGSVDTEPSGSAPPVTDDDPDQSMTGADHDAHPARPRIDPVDRAAG